MTYHGVIMNMPPRNSLPFDLPANYQISVQGWIDPSWSDRLEGMAISQAEVVPDLKMSTLEGSLIDQAALAGVLNTLYELHLPVLLVKRLDTQWIE
jgi:hypothetical protein